MVSQEQSREELERVLATGLLARSARQAKLLRYICEKTLAGEAESIKEYSIAVEALGRGADFDKSTDSTVRFEAHRLRKKLRRYYETGAHQVCILLEPGAYVPRFLDPGEYRMAIQGPRPEEPEVPETHQSRRWWWAAGAAGIVVAVVLAYLALRGRGAPVAPARVAGAATASESGIIRILAGMPSSGYVDQAGRFWSGDSYFDGGVARRRNVEHIHRTGDPGLFQGCRMGPEFGYSIPAGPGSYQLRLYFNDPDSSADQARTFTVSINGREALRDLDVTLAAGERDAALVRAFRNVEPDRDGKIQLHFAAVWGTAFVNAIEIIPMARSWIRPIRLTTQRQPVTDHAGNLWEADDFYDGGRQFVHGRTVQNTPDAVLYKAQRFGNFSYYIPVPPGEYSVKLLLAEAGNAPPSKDMVGLGSRVFEVSCNGRALLSGLDAFKEAGGASRALVLMHHGLKPTPDGQLVIGFSRVIGSAMVSAIEVEDETP